MDNKLYFSQKALEFALNDSTSWAGVDAPEFYSKALLDDSVLSTFKTIPNVKSKIKLAKLSAADIIQPYDDTTFTATDMTLSQKLFTVNEYKINLEIAQSVLENNYLSTKLASGSLGNVDQIAPSEFLNYALDFTARTVANDLHLAAFGASASTYPYNRMDSVIKIAKADSATIKVSATASITSTNVLDEVFKVINVLPKAIDKKATIYVSTAIMRALKYAFGKSLSGLPYIINADSSVSFLGYTIIEAQGLADNNMFAGENGPEGNFVKLVDADTDQSNLNVIPMIQTLGIHTLRIVGAFKYAVGYIKSDEVVVYS